METTPNTLYRISVTTIPASKQKALNKLPFTAVFTLVIIDKPNRTSKANTVQIK